MGTGTCTTAQKLPVVITPMTDEIPPKPALVDGPLRLAVLSGSGTFSQDPATPLEFFAITGDDPGDTVIELRADADLGAGVEEIVDTFTLTATSVTAKNFGFQVGTAVPKV